MYNLNTPLSIASACERCGRVIFSLVACSLVSLGCAHQKQTKGKPVLERGWIGGEYKLAHVHHQVFSARETVNAFPPALSSKYKTGILLTSLSTNTPAQIGGLREGDLILTVDQQPVARLQDFRLAIDRSKPGAEVNIHVLRDGKFVDCVVVIGRERFRPQGELMIALPLITRELDLWPNPGISLIVLGYAPNPGHRVELGSAEARYQQLCDPKNYQANENDWRAWLVILQLSKGKAILSQDRVEAPKRNLHRDSRELECAAADYSGLQKVGFNAGVDPGTARPLDLEKPGNPDF